MLAHGLKVQYSKASSPELWTNVISSNSFLCSSPAFSTNQLKFAWKHKDTRVEKLDLKKNEGGLFYEIETFDTLITTVE